MRFAVVLSGLFLVSSTATHAMSLGGGAGYFTGETSEPRNAGSGTWKLSSPAWSFKLVDPEGSLLSAMSTASSNYGQMLGAQQRAQEEANRTGGSATATYEVKTSVSSTGSTQSLEVIWAHDGEFEHTDSYSGKVVDKAPDNLTIQGALSGNIYAWNGIGGISLSAIPYWKMVVGYMDLKSSNSSEVSSTWFTFPFGGALVYDAPLNISLKGYGGYDPVTGLVSIWSKGVHQAWEYGAGAEWAPFGWLVAEAGFNAGMTNLQETELPKFATTTLNFGARIDFDGF